MSASNLHTAWAKLFLRALATAGVTRVVISPGSRSTPLALAAAAEPGVRCEVAVDERTAAFFALGQARVTGRPSALICTSGTAGAHYLPAVIEAAQSFLPLVVVTADRPWEAYDAAAAQTIDQVKLFGDFARHYAELGLPDAAPTALRAVVRIAAQAVARAHWPVPGPVHINARFRKPLEPVDVATPEAWEPAVADLMRRGAPAVHLPRSVPAPETLDALADVLRRAERPLLVCGPSLGPTGAARQRDRDAVLALGRALGAPVLAEATSQVRFGSAGHGAVVCGAFDALVRDRAFRARHRPDVVVEFGAPPVSSAYAAWMTESDAHRCVVAPHGWNDPLGSAAMMLFGDAAALAAPLAARVTRAAGAWASAFARAEARAWACAARELEGPALTEGVIAHRLVDALPAGAVLAVGNSSPVRDLDTYCPPGTRALRVLHQRGASGIDGLVSGAAGARAESDAPVALLLGDVSLLHDLAGLNLARAARGPLVIVAVQNDGGRIFEQLPLGARPELGDAFERLFATPQGLSFEHAAAMFAIAYHRAETPAALAAALAAGLARDGCTLIEAVVPPHDGAARRATLFRAVAAANAASEHAPEAS